MVERVSFEFDGYFVYFVYNFECVDCIYMMLPLTTWVYICVSLMCEVMHTYVVSGVRFQCNTRCTCLLDLYDIILYYDQWRYTDSVILDYFNACTAIRHALIIVSLICLYIGVSWLMLIFYMIMWYMLNEKHFYLWNMNTD